MCIHFSHKRHLSNFCIWSLTALKAGSRQHKKELRENHWAATGKQREGDASGAPCKMLKETTQEIPVGTKKRGGGGSRGHILTGGTEVLQLSLLETRKLHHAWKQGSADYQKTGTLHYWLSFKPHPHFNWFPWGNKATAQLTCSPNHLFEICWENLAV